ncbi:uncharacterized protein FOMMEDRAFT_82108 [Fomitiporia mediterranea MF3/22]|uniref:uncharacterized protein n=1 Tax=Fomitiporia mediterranea (strain MF3/22) TaxID=694068 RepID=UPI0004409B22|nr:uncharacterized protein FOMMEDRAFT_82108 [Fomitiporia mediterranea MF3/22]EJD04115.1 hypothetical protein FOMMEDRAFT_82108 [Fomitiporia mediterranea MF3/22]
MATRPHVEVPTEYGNAASWWVEYPDGLVDLSRSVHLYSGSKIEKDEALADSKEVPKIAPAKPKGLLDIAVDKERMIRVDPRKSALVVIDMQNNWGLTQYELHTIPPSLVRGFMKSGSGGFGAELPGNFGPLLMRGAQNSELYGPLQEEYERGKREGTDVWIHKNRMSGLWGPQSSLDLYLQEEGIETLFMSGVNADQVKRTTKLVPYVVLLELHHSVF